MHTGLLTLLILSAGLFMTATSHAQNMQWGTGMAMGQQQGCGYQQQPQQMRGGMGSPASAENEAVNDLLDQQKELKQTLQGDQKKQKALEKDLEKLHDTISESLNSETSEFAFAHMENDFRCDQYRASEDDQNKLRLTGLNAEGLSRYCDAGKAGSLRGELCSDARYRAGENSRGESACKKALPDYRKKYVESQKLADNIDRTKQRLDDIKNDIADARKEARQERNNGTEGDICLECLAKGSGYQSAQQPRSTDWANVAANVGTGLVAMYMGYQTNKMVAQYDSNLGWPTQSSPAWSYGLPYMTAGLYGALGGGNSQASFGCSGSNGMYSMGYSPHNMMGMGSMTGMNGMTGYDTSSAQMQMYQNYMLQQQLYTQNYQSRSQTMTSLQSELSNLMSRIQQVQYGNYYGTSTIYLSSGTNGVTVNGAIPAPSLYTSSGVISGTTSNIIPATTIYSYGR